MSAFPKTEKMYYKIGEVAKMFQVNTSLIRFWEKEFDIIKPKKNKKGNRLFTPEDVENFRIIYHLVKERGFTLKGAKEKLNQNRDKTIENAEIVISLQKIKTFLLDLKEQLDNLPVLTDQE
ncbi:MAG: MerR family transcriptional regulator [Lentimicrobium sp.]|jgi:DNA-binding transcriptional MerR regulator|nr:MerR family transcriptional regulator [Lentimicrobium sp.]